MKKAFNNFIILAFMVLLTGNICAQNIKGADITFEKLVHDYGTIYQNDNGVCTFKFTNTGTEPLVLTNVTASCGCTIPQWPKEPVLPGQSNTIKVIYDTKRIGPINKSISVTSNAVHANVNLSIRGNVLKKPDEIMPFNNIGNFITPTNK